jgi:hypothetical protein
MTRLLALRLLLTERPVEAVWRSRRSLCRCSGGDSGFASRFGLLRPIPGRSARHAAMESPIRFSPAAVVHSLMRIEPSTYSLSCFSIRPSETAASPGLQGRGTELAANRFDHFWR